MRTDTAEVTRGAPWPIGRLVGMALALLVGSVGFAHPSAKELARPKQAPPGNDLEAIEVQPGLYMIAGAGGNIAADIGDDGIVVVDTGTAQQADQVIALLRQLTPKPIRYIINTSADPDRVGGNEKLSQAGKPILPEGYRRVGLRGREFAPILAEQHVQDTMASGTPPAPDAAWPSLTYSVDGGETQRKMFLNGQGIQVLYQKHAHSDGDSLVHFRRSDVIVTGEIMDPTRFPVFDSTKGGSVQGIIDSLNGMIDVSIWAVPFPYQEGGTLFIPGHGRVCTVSDVVEYRDMVTIIRDRVQDGVKKGLTLDQVQQANPAQGYRRRYGSDSGPWTTDMFIAAIYNDLSGKRAGQP